jgi:hypothetical protein
MRGIDNNTTVYLLLMVIITFANCSLAIDPFNNNVSQHSNIKPIKSYPNGGTLNLTFKSKIDGSIQPMPVRIPKGYTPKKSWPLTKGANLCHLCRRETVKLDKSS